MRFFSAWIVVIALLLSQLMPDLAQAQSTPDTKPMPQTLVHVASIGSVPGFTTKQLNAYLAKAMQKASPPSLRMTAEPAITADAQQVIWTFKLLRTVWKGGMHSGFPAPNNSVLYLSAEVRSYVAGEYQMTLAVHPSIVSGDANQSLADMATYAAHVLFVQNGAEHH